MGPAEIRAFLEAVDAELTQIAGEGERLPIYLLGRAALILRYGLGLATKDVDLVIGGHEPELRKQAFARFGVGTPNAQRWGLYLEPVPEDFPPVPGSYRRLSTALSGTWTVLEPRLLDPHALAISKLRRFHSGDRQDLRILCDSGDLSVTELEKALDSAYPHGMDEDENPDCKRVNEHFRKVIAYLNGESRDL